MLFPDWSQQGSKEDLEESIGDFEVKLGWHITAHESILCVPGAPGMWKVYCWNSITVRDEWASALALPLFQ